MPATHTPCLFCAQPVSVVLLTCPHCGRQARTSPAAIEKGTREANLLMIWHRKPELAPPEFWYPPRKLPVADAGGNPGGRDARPTEGTSASEPAPPRRKAQSSKPKPIASEAHRLHIEEGLTQKETAKRLSEIFDQDVRQDNVSRWSKSVERYRGGAGA